MVGLRLKILNLLQKLVDFRLMGLFELSNNNIELSDLVKVLSVHALFVHNQLGLPFLVLL